MRTSLALSLVTGRAFKIINIRAARKRPGLMPQHLAAVNAAAQVSCARVSGNYLNSRSLSFAPGTVKPGNYHFAIETAGSATLVLQTVLPAMLCAGSNSSMTLTGGTHNPFSPPFDFLARTFVPIINRMGPQISLSLNRFGFYPAGGGSFSIEVEPCGKLGCIELMERGPVLGRQARAIVARLPMDICDRELAALAKRLSWPKDLLRAEKTEDSNGPGNVLMVEIESAHITEVFTAFGQKGIPSKRVAANAAAQVTEYMAADVPVGRHLADQLLIPIAMAGEGRYRTLSVTAHTLTNIEVIKRFLEVDISVDELGKNTREVRIKRS